MGAPFYQQPQGLPAAAGRRGAGARATRSSQAKGDGLLIHDAYRPWHVTKMFWDATPEQFHDFVADPPTGSRHNRGCAVDLTLYDLASGEPVEMVSGTTSSRRGRSPHYPGGTSRERWHRELDCARPWSRKASPSTPLEWWHFDYKDWKKYPISNATFEGLEANAAERP